VNNIYPKYKKPAIRRA